MEAQKINIGDRVFYHSRPYKVVHIYNNGNLKLVSTNGKTNEIIFNASPELLDQEDK